MRSTWKRQSFDSKPLTMSEFYKVLRRNSLLQRLRRRAFAIGVVGLTAPLWIIAFSQIHPVSLLCKITYIAFLLLCSGLSFYWWYRLGKAYHYMAIPLIEAQQKMENLDRLRRNIKIWSWILGIPVIGVLMYEICSQGSDVEIIGAIVGAIVGGTIGLIMEIQNRRQIKAVKRSFNDSDDFDMPDV